MKVLILLLNVADPLSGVVIQVKQCLSLCISIIAKSQLAVLHKLKSPNLPAQIDQIVVQTKFCACTLYLRAFDFVYCTGVHDHSK